MLVGTAKRLETVQCDRLMNNALLESFCIHARNVLDFLYFSKSRHPDDLSAEDFLVGSGGWNGQMPEPLRDIYKAVCKRVAHLTTVRLSITPDEKAWKYSEITKDICACLRKFIDLVPKEKLGQRWDVVKTAGFEIPSLSASTHGATHTLGLLPPSNIRPL